MDKDTKKKLVFAILQGDDYEQVVRELNKNGFYVTLLNSVGGFLKKRSVTIMIGVEEVRLEELLDILRDDIKYGLIPGKIKYLVFCLLFILYNPIMFLYLYNISFAPLNTLINIGIKLVIVTAAILEPIP